MLRIEFVKSLTGALIAGLGSVRSWFVPERQVVLFEGYVAGYRYYGGQGLEGQMMPGTPLSLVRETANPYDDRAIAVWCMGEKIGYIPRKDNPVLASMMDQGLPLSGTLESVTPEEPTHTRVYIRVRLQWPEA